MLTIFLKLIKWVKTKLVISDADEKLKHLHDFGWWWQGSLCEEGRNKVHYQWSLLLQPSFDHQCGWCWGCAFSVHQRVKNWMAIHVKKLGPKLAEQLLPEWTSPFFSSHNQWWQNCGKLQCGTRQLAIWADLPRRPILETLLQWG